MTRRDDDLSGLVLSLAGAGRVGASLARWAVARGAELAAVSVHRRHDCAEALAAVAEAAGRRPRLVPLDELESADHDVLLVAVSDPALDAVAAALGRRSQARVALHTAGSRGASALAPLAAGGSATGTLHPLKAFPRVLADPAAGNGVLFALDGAPAAVEMGRRLAHAWGGVPREVPEDARDLYHLAATLAAGGVVTLLAAAARIAHAAGLPAEVESGYAELARGAVAAAGEEVAGGGTAAGALTGPVARGDAATVERQLDALEERLPELVPLVARLGEEALVSLRRAGSRDAGRDQLLDALRRRLETTAR